MSRILPKNTLVRTGLLLLVVFALLLIGVQFMAKGAVSDFLERKIPAHIQLVYKDMDVNILTGSVALDSVALDFFDRDSMLLNTHVRMDAISLEGLGYLDFLFNETIDVRRLLLKRPEVRYYPYRLMPKTQGEPQGVVQLLKTIEVDELAVKDGRLDLFQEGTDSISLKVREVNFVVENAKTDPELINRKIPVEYGNYQLDGDSLYVDLGPYEELQALTVLWNQTQAKVTELKLRSKYDKAELSKKLTSERDHIDLHIPTMHLDSIRFGFEKDTFFIETGTGTIKRPELEIYRDKLVADDNSEKQLYSRVIRQMPIHINVPEIKIEDGDVVYSERVADVETPGKLSFQNLDATLTNVSNRYPPGGKTVIKAKTKFMGYADMTLDWSFDVNRKNDAFMAAGTVFGFDTKSVNPFLESNSRARAKGTINEMYFTVSGDAFSSSGDMKMKYENFSFEIFKKDGSGINRFLTAIGNLFVDSGDRTDAKGYRYGNIQVERDREKSFFNYLWLNVRDGTISTLTGDGEKD